MWRWSAAVILQPYFAMFTAIIHLVVLTGRAKVLSSTPERLNVELECRPGAEGFLPGKSCSPPLPAHGVRRLPQATRHPLSGALSQSPAGFHMTGRRPAS